MSDKPTSPSDPRPNDEPYYIDSECPDCGTELALYDELTDEDGETWHDEWMCPECREGIHMDWPEEYKEEIFGRAEDQNT